MVAENKKIQGYGGPIPYRKTLERVLSVQMRSLFDNWGVPTYYESVRNMYRDYKKLDVERYKVNPERAGQFAYFVKEALYYSARPTPPKIKEIVKHYEYELYGYMKQYSIRKDDQDYIAMGINVKGALDGFGSIYKSSENGILTEFTNHLKKREKLKW